MSDELQLGAAVLDWLEDGPTRAPDHVLEAALFEIDTTPQGRGLPVSLRLPASPGRSRFLAAIAIVVAVTAGTILAIQANDVPAEPRNPVGSGVAATASPRSPSPPAPSGVALTSTFTSGRYGYSLRVAPSWSVAQATLTWTGPDNSGDVVDRIDTHGVDSPALVIQAASQPLAPAATLDQWVGYFQSPARAITDCLGGAASTWPLRTVGQYAWRWQQRCTSASAITETGGRVYVFACVGCTEADDAATAEFDRILATVRLDPASAAPLPSAPPLDRTFVSARNGFSVRYPADWSFVRLAAGPASFTRLLAPSDAAADAIGSRTVQLSVTSLPLPPAMSAADWAGDFCLMTWTPWVTDCTTKTLPWEPVAIDGHPGWITANGEGAGDYPSSPSRLFVATVVTGGRAYEIRLDGAAERSLFLALLDSMHLDPTEASPATPAP